MKYARFLMLAALFAILLSNAVCAAAPESEVLGVDQMESAQPQEALDAVTDDFHADRYAETGLPPDAIADLTKALQCIRHIT